jgi:hypothetical protein
MSGIYRGLKRLRRKTKQAYIDFVRAIGAKTVLTGAPTGTFSILEDPAAVHVVMKEQQSFPATPGSLRDISHLEQDKTQPWPIFWAHIPNARLVGGSLGVLNDQKKIMVESLYGPVHYRTDPSWNYLTLPPALPLSGNWTSLMGRWTRTGLSTFAHWLLDGLPRLALLENFPEDTRILVPAGLLPSQRETLEILGVWERCRPTAEIHVVVENYYHASFTSMSGCDNPFAIEYMRAKFLPAAAPIALTSGKIYIARKGAGRTPLQEEEMIEFLQGERWTIIAAEKYSFREQISLFQTSHAICSIHGAGLGNLLWCEKGTKVLELCAANYLNGSLEGLAIGVGLDHRFLVFPADAQFRIDVDMDRFKAAIKAME